MANPYGIKTLIKKTFAGRFFIARLSRYPIIGKLLDAALFAEDDIMYLPADRSIEINKRLTGRQDMVLPSQVLDEIIDRANHHWLMDFCICRDSADCQDYPKNPGCLFMGAACRGCGRCVSVCPNGAIELTITDGAFVEKALQRLTAAVDLS